MTLLDLFPAPATRHAPGNPLRWAVGVVTAPRKGNTSYLDHTLATVAQAGFPRPWVFAEPGSWIPPSYDGPVVKWPERLGVYPNHLAALTVLRRGQSTQDADAFLTLECDVTLSPGLREYLESHVLWPAPPASLGFISLYTPAVAANAEPGWHRYGGSFAIGQTQWVGFWGTQAIVMSREAVDSYLSSPYHVQHRENENPAVNNMYADGELAKWARFKGKAPFYAVGRGGASLVRHDGDNSSVFGFGIEWRREHAFAGDLLRGKAIPAAPIGETTQQRKERRLAICQKCDAWRSPDGVQPERCAACGCADPRTAENLGELGPICPRSVPGWL